MSCDVGQYLPDNDQPLERLFISRTRAGTNAARHEKLIRP